MGHFKYAFRQLVLRPGLSGIVIVMLALGIGATTAMFSLYHQILVRPLPVPEPERLVNLAAPGPAKVGGAYRDLAIGDRELEFSYGMFRDLERRQTGFTGIAGQSRDVFVPVSSIWTARRRVSNSEPRETEILVRLRDDVSVVQAATAITPFLQSSLEEGESVRAEIHPHPSPNALSVEMLAVLSPIVAAFVLVLVAGSGFLFGMVGFLAIFLLNQTDRIPQVMRPAFVCLFAVTFSVTAGVIWEIFEYVMDLIAPSLNMQTGETGVHDTMNDLIVDTAGAVIVATMGWAYIKSGRYSFIADAVRASLAAPFASRASRSQ